MTVAALLLAGQTQAEPCSTRLSESDLLAEISSAEGSYDALDATGFQEKIALFEQLTCLEAPVQPATAAALHRLWGMQALVGGDLEMARVSYVAARRLEPDYVHPLQRFPPGHEVYTLDQPALVSMEAEVLPAPGVGLLYLDGAVGLERVSAVPVLFQYDGEALQSRYLLPGDPTPEYSTRRPPRWSWRLMGASGALGGAAAGMYTASWLARQEFLAGGGDESDQLALYEATNTRLQTAVWLGGAAAAGAVAAVFVRSW